MKFLGLFVSLCLVSQTAIAKTNSQKYSWLEQDSAERTTFVMSRDDKLNDAVKKDANSQGIGNWLKQTFSVRTVRKQVTLVSGDKLSLVDHGLSKPTDLVLTHGSNDISLFSNTQQGTQDPVHFVDFGLSPDEKLVYLIFAARGSIDGMSLRIYDLKARQFLADGPFLYEQDLAWASPTSLFVDIPDKKGEDSFGVYDISTQAFTALADTSLIDDGFGFVIFEQAEKIFIRNSGTGVDIPLSVAAAPRSIVFVDEAYVYFKARGQKGLGEIRRIARDTTARTEGEVVVPESALSIDGVMVADRYFVVNSRMGAERTSTVYDTSGKMITKVPIPDCCSLKGVRWKDVGHELIFDFASAAQKSSGYIWDIKKSAWSSSTLSSDMMANQQVQLTTEVVQAKSLDGTLIPVRLTYRSDLKKDGKNPVLFYSYGGFGLSGYLDPSYSVINMEFLKRGGILAGPGLRGGNEFGALWHTQATKVNKIKTMQDLIASAHEVVTLGWTTPAKIISAGISNGGLTVASSALLAPDAFGLVIPMSGVHDLLGKERLDARNGGWSFEYGSEKKDAEVGPLTAISPVEQAANMGKLRFLIIDGLSDTRVNPTNSLKLAAALEDSGGSPANVMLSSTKNSGHWLMDISYQNLIAWHVDTVMWTKIFEVAGWAF